MSGLGYINKLKEGCFEPQEVAVKNQPGEEMDKKRQLR
jgi:hypothetical protein